MKLGFVSAILPEWTLDQVLAFAAQEQFRCVEVMCWPVGKADRRFAGVTHIDVDTLPRPGSMTFMGPARNRASPSPHWATTRIPSIRVPRCPRPPWPTFAR